MAWDSAVDWEKVFSFDMPVLEIIVRGSCIYLSLFFLLRFVLKRQSGALGITDILVIALIADAAQNGMAGTYNSVPAGILLVTTLVMWNAALEWLGFHCEAFERILTPPPLPLIRHGRMIRKNMQKELVSEDELMSKLRVEGVEHLADVKTACMEGDGQISVITYDHKR